jgi:hypothetical protein
MTNQQIVAYTLVDITSSGTVRIRDANTKAYHQMQNLNVLLQTIGLRTQPIDPSVKQLLQQDLAEYNFSTAYTGSHAVWRLTFDIQHHLVWQHQTDELGLLKIDANGVAITPDLDETVPFDTGVFDTLNCVNLYFVVG